MELLVVTGSSLSATVGKLPEAHVVHETVSTPWEQKGHVMRSLIERSAERELVLVDGVKILRDDGWVLAVPDPEEPITHVWAEAPNDREARGPCAGVRAAHPTAGSVASFGNEPYAAHAGLPAVGFRAVTRKGENLVMDHPDELRYTEDHEWVRVEDGLVRIGLTDYAQDALGDVVFLEVPETGRKVAANEAFSEVESTKSVSDIYAPVRGTIVEVNDLLEAAPEKINEDPYGDGWICVIKPDSVADIESLLTASQYRAMVEG